MRALRAPAPCRTFQVRTVIEPHYIARDLRWN
jgi:hypothetical protein